MSTGSRLRGAWNAARRLREDRRAARRVVREIERGEGLDPALLHRFLRYSPDALLRSVATRAAAITTTVGAATALVIGALFAGYPEIPDAARRATPGLALGERLHAVFNYLHSIHDGNVEVRHLVDHIPDLGFDLALLAPLYGAAVWAYIHFGWRRNLARCQESARTLIADGGFPNDAPLAPRWRMRPGHTALIVGDGDPLADEYARRRDPGDVLVYAARRQEAADVWVALRNDPSIGDLERAFASGDFARCGCLMLMPVQARHMVFPPADAYDISPDKLDDVIGNIRALAARRADRLTIIVVGDRKQRTVIRSYDAGAAAAAGEAPTEITLATIERRAGDGLIVIDPTELVLERVMQLAAGARIDFRGTEQSRRTYEGQFRERLGEAGYRVTDPQRVFRMGYNITDDPTVADPLNSAAVILTASARDALLQKGYPPERILYVPELVIDAVEARLG